MLPDDTVTYWTCGSEGDPDQIETTIEKLQNLSQETVGEINKIDEDLDNLKSKYRNRQDQQRYRERLDRRKRKLKDEMEDTETRIKTLSKRRDALREEIETVEPAVENLEDDAYKEILDLHKEANQLEYDLGTLENDLDGTTYEDTVDHLSESEREVMGLIFVLAGYLAHEVYETVPFMLLDSLEAIDADRIARLIKHIEEYSEYLIIALLPEDTAVLDNEDKMITNI